MKRNIVKNILKTCAAVLLAASLAGCSNLIVSDDDSDNSKIADVLPSSESSKKSVGAGTVAVTIGVPDYSKIAAENVSRSARAVAPQTTYARLGYSTDGEKFVYSDAVELTGGTSDSTGIFTQYTLTFSGIPAGTYAAGRLQIQLLKTASSTEAVTQGTNAQTVTVSSSADADATFYTVPTTLAKETGSLSKGEMVFLSKSVAANSVSTLTLTVGENDSYPLVALFNPDGSFKSATELSSSSNTLEIDRSEEAESAVYYIGLYSKDADISAYTATWADEVYFTKFDPDDLYALYGNGSITKDVSAADGSWSVTGGTSSAYAGVWTNKSGELKTYDYDSEKGTGFDYTNERLFYFNYATSVALKLKIGAGKTKVLRIDGGADCNLAKWWSYYKAVTFNIKDSEETAKTWSPYVSNSTYYVEVTGDSDGYVTISAANQSGFSAVIYGITLADEAVDLSSKERSEKYSWYGWEVSLDNTTADLNGNADGVKLTATSTLTLKEQTKYAAFDGTSPRMDGGVDTTVTDAAIAYVWTKNGTVIDGATSSSYTATSSGTYTVAASYTDSNGKVYKPSDSSSLSCKVFNSGVTGVTITFDKNYTNATITTTTQPLENDVGTLTKASELGLVNNEKVFNGWATTAGATEVEYADGAEVTFSTDTTLYAVWAENFTKFTAEELREKYREENLLSVGKTDEVKIENSNFSYDNDNIIVSKGVQIKYTEATTVDYDEAAGTGHSYDYRFAFNSKNAPERGIKLRIGAGQTKILRIDGGQATNLKDWTSEIPSVTLTIKDSSGEKTWKPYVRNSTFFVEVTGDSEGYITITSADCYYDESNNKQVGGEIDGIYVVDAKADLSSYTQTYTGVTYNSPVVTLDSTADLAGNESVVLTATAATPTKTTTTKTAVADGTEKPTVATNDEEISDVLSYQWYKSGEEIEGATEATYNATSSATYSVKVSYSYKDDGGNEKSKSTTAECVVSDSKASKVVVEFDKNSSTASISTDELEIERGAEVSLAKADDLGLVNSGYAFMGWATSADGKVSYTDGADISFYHNTTLYAVWVAKSSGELVGYPNASGEWTQEESGLPADAKDSAANTILAFVKVEALKAETCKGVDIDGNSFNYTTRITTKGSTSSSRYIKITVPEGKAADVFCAFKSGDSSTRSCGIGKKAGQYYDVAEKASSSSSSTLSYLSTDVALPAGTYYLNSDAYLYIFALQVKLYSED